jgi:holin-like protein
MKTMHARMRLLARRRPLLALILQVLLLTLFWYACDALARGLHLPLPGSVLALGLLLLLFATGAVPMTSLRRGADWLLAEMLLFFIPAVMAVWQHLPLLRQEGLRIMVVILCGTLLVMVTTALLVDRVFRWRQRHAR